MENELTTRVSRLEMLTARLGQANEITNSVITELTSEFSGLVRGQIKEELATKAEEIKSDVITTVNGKIEDTVRTVVNERGLNRTEMNLLTKARHLRFRQLLGDSHSDKYILLISFYQGAMIKEYRKIFDCTAYGDIEATRFNEAMDYVKNFNVTVSYYDWAIEKLHEQYRDGEIEKRKKFNAYERFFGIVV